MKQWPFSGRFERWIERRWRARYLLCEGIPDKDEQDAAEHHCLHRPLERGMDAPRAAAAVGLFLVATLLATLGLARLLRPEVLLPYLPGALAAVAQDHPGWWSVLLWLAVTTLGFIIVLRRALIGAIRLYQRYAPEDVRRRCLFLPTCSEYGILALQKYGLVIGLWKLYDRLVVRCRGNVYRINYP